jgi:hypothetical protein
MTQFKKNVTRSSLTASHYFKRVLFDLNIPQQCNYCGAGKTKKPRHHCRGSLLLNFVIP